MDDDRVTVYDPAGEVDPSQLPAGVGYEGELTAKRLAKLAAAAIRYNLERRGYTASKVVTENGRHVAFFSVRPDKDTVPRFLVTVERIE